MGEGSKTLALKVDSLKVHRSGTEILHSLSLEISAGAPFAIVGESGSGKTTLLHAVMGLLPVSAGSISVFGESLANRTPQQRAERVGLVFQDYQLFPHLSVMENLKLAPRLLKRAHSEEDANALLSTLGIQDLQHRYPHELSGGQKQRVAIARALMLSPKIVFFDEPSAALDIQTSRELSKTLKRLQGKTQVVVVSHDREFVRDCCEQGALMDSGNIYRVSSVLEIMQ